MLCVWKAIHRLQCSCDFLLGEVFERGQNELCIKIRTNYRNRQLTEWLTVFFVMANL